MSATTDVLKGRFKEAAGALIDDDKLREEGKADQVTGAAKQAEVAQKAADEAKVAAEKADIAADKARVAAEKVDDKAKDDTETCAT